MSRQVLHGSAGEYQADEQAGVERLSWRVVSSFRLPSGHSGLVLTLSNAARASLPSPRLLVANARVCAVSPLEVTTGHVICGF